MSSEFEPGPAATAVISLSQAILAPLDALAKAQVHAARSFLSFVLQMGFPDVGDEDGEGHTRKTDEDKQATGGWLTKFAYGDDKEKVEYLIPTLALLPLQPLSIEKAEYSVELTVTHVEKHMQKQNSEERRPWYLIKEPISVRGTFGSPGKKVLADQTEDDAPPPGSLPNVKVTVTVGQVPTPDGLSKLIAAQTQMAFPKPAAVPVPADTADGN